MNNKIDLKNHNLETYNIIKETYTKRNHIGTVQATGTGKSFIIAKSIQDMKPEKTLFLTSSLHIIDEFKSNFSFLSHDITFMTYKKLTYIKDLESFLKEEDFDFVILDEYHRCGAKTWGKAVKHMLSYYKDKKVLGTTATPVRFLDSCRDMTKELFDSEPVVEISLLKAIEMNILPKPKYILSYYDINDDIEALRKKAKLSKNVDITEKVQFIVNNMDKLVNAEDVLAKNINNERKFIIFCSNVNHAKEMLPIVSNWFKDIGFNPKTYSVYIDSNDRYSTKKMKLELEDFKKYIPTKNEVHLMFSVNILNEGVHIQNVDGLIFLRKTVSPIIMYQQLGRALKSGDSKSPIIFDFVNNINGLSFTGDYPIFNNNKGNTENSNFDYSIDGTIEVIDYTAKLNELLKDINDMYSYINWESFISAIKEYYTENKNCNIPANHKLYKKCLSIRRDYANGILDNHKFEELDKLGFKWDISIYNDELWEEMYERLKDFAKEHKHANVLRSYKDSQLATWVQTQRKFKDSMPKKRKERLLSIGFEFELAKKKNEQEWYNMFNELLKFKDEFNHVNVSSRYKDKKLANWVNSQRKSYKAGKLSDDRYNKLLSIGFKFPETSI